MYQSDKTVCSVLDNETSSDGDNTGFCVNKVSDVSSSDHTFIDFCFEPKKTRQTRVVRFIYDVNSFKQFWSLDFKTPLQAPKSDYFLIQAIKIKLDIQYKKTTRSVQADVYIVKSYKAR